MKRYFCCICHQELKEEKPIRLVKQKYGIGTYKQYGNVRHYDFCEKCYSVFNNWVKKHKEEVNNVDVIKSYYERQKKLELRKKR